MNQPREFPDQMISVPRHSSAAAGIPYIETFSGEANARPARPKFDIVMDAADGTRLLHLFEDEHGYLRAEFDESRLDEAAKKFLDHMMQWSGVVGVRWKDEAGKTGEMP